MSSIIINPHPFGSVIQQKHKSREVQLTPSALETLSNIKEDVHKSFENKTPHEWTLHDDDSTTIKACIQEWKERHLLHIR